MKIVLIKPSNEGILGLEMITFVEPLGLECLAGVLEPAGHECHILDFRIDGTETGLKRCEDLDAPLVGIQCNFTTERYRAVLAAREIKRRQPGTLVVMGGHDVSRDPAWFDDPAIDILAVGDGEEIMPELVEALEHDADLGKVPGLVLNTPKGQQSTGPAPRRKDLNTLPLPARHLIPDYAPHYFINLRKPLALMETARGCPFTCNFCSVWKFHERSFRQKSPARVVEELRTIEAPNVFITDDIFWLHVGRGREMAEEIKASGIRKFFTVQTRTDIIVKHPELVEQWKDCGHLAVFLGVEKVDDAGLSSVNKKNSADTNLRAIEMLKEMGVGFTCNFIVDPSWGSADFARLRDWISRHGTYNSGFSVLTPLPGTDLWDEVKDQVNTEDWELFDIAHSVLPTHLSLEDFYTEFAGLWKHSLEVRYRYRGKYRLYLQAVAALLMGKVKMGDLKRGFNMAELMGRPDHYLQQHHESAAKLASIRAQLAEAL